MSGADALAGGLYLRPGSLLPTVQSTRRAWVRRLTAGKRASALPGLLAALLPLCGDAHRQTAQAAVAAAQGLAQTSRMSAADRALQIDTLREQLRRIWLDWPGALGGAAPLGVDIAVLRDCPVLRFDAPADAALAAMPHWLAAQLLGQPTELWLAGWEADPAAWLDHWCGQADTLPARLLRGCRDAALALAGAPVPLRVHAQPDTLATLGAELRADPRFVLAPKWQGSPAETGPWTRLNDRAAERHDSAWLRLGSRLAEAVRLGLPDQPARSGAQWLRHGAQALAAGEGLAWCEMARGLLVHRVRLDDPAPATTAAGADPRVAECDLLAPTEWNFHPCGAVAQALAAMPVDAEEASVRLLAAAFDPCVTVHLTLNGCDLSGAHDA